MAWQKDETFIAITNLSVRFYQGDASATPPNESRVEFTVRSSNASGLVQTEVFDVAISQLVSLNSQQQTDLIIMLSSIGIEALTALGYADLP